MKEKEKMLLGQIYNANYDKELIEERTKTQDLCFKYNNKCLNWQMKNEEESHHHKPCIIRRNNCAGENVDGILDHF